MEKTEQMQAAEKHALVQTINTPGWRVVTKILDALVKEAEDQAFAGEDLSLLREAKAARAFHGKFINRIDQQKFLDAGPDPEFTPQEDF